MLQLNYWRGPIDAWPLLQNIAPPQDRRPCAIAKLLRPNACQLHAIPSQTQRTVRLRGSVNGKQRFDLHCAIGYFDELCNSETAVKVWRACVLSRWPRSLESTS